MLKKSPVTNQAVIEIARPEDVWECRGKDGKDDPPCLRLITFKAIPDADGRFKLNMSVFFRSWDFYAGMPINLFGLSELQKFVAEEAGMEVGHMFAFSDGLHLYKYQKELAEMRLRRENCPDY